ncbi:MAG: zinc-dependent peptidase [Gammaproteobacteria bacterium]|nr:zinc-dependent peptidase [Gammaproteobacteria bacterium]
MTAFQRIQQWRVRRILRKYPIEESVWRATLEALPWLPNLDTIAQARLRDYATLFLADKIIVGAQGYEVPAGLRVAIAVQACLLVLFSNLDAYRGFRSIIVYADEYIVAHTSMDDAGIVHARRDIRAGEAWREGPVVLAASAILHDGRGDGMNIVIHEFAHQLDMQNGDANGFPPLPKDIAVTQWTQHFTRAYADFCRRVDGEEHTALDPYGSEAPEEFFAVMCEAFFLIPATLNAEYPNIFQLLKRFFRFDPLHTDTTIPAYT